ncbi:2-aminoethanethiol dioxygenase [Araneus ventricosus]|uniref:2-aminoethanethiol dioxygenase n=1 Tax=Araneus ventricosus TaxID=182803 RepID=A0A4Y2BMS0_ARAVE|nr:2-aminoethanethiol dioxygenase [Araneus ventricosus]
MSSIVELIAKQAQATFSRSITEESFLENLTKLIKNVNKVRASDLKLNKDTLRTINSDNDDKRLAPVTYIEVAENKTFSMGIFLLRSGARIPLHDHPGMHGVLKVIQGTVKITSYSAVSKVPSDIKLPQDIYNRVKGVQKERLIPVEKHSSGNVTEKDEPCVLKPKEGNFHEICAVGGTAAFLDILAPPYDMNERDCHYYVPLETSKTDSEVKCWLLRTTPPSDFWCESADYTGPKVSL